MSRAIIDANASLLSGVASRCSTVGVIHRDPSVVANCAHLRNGDGSCSRHYRVNDSRSIFVDEGAHPIQSVRADQSGVTLDGSPGTYSRPSIVRAWVTQMVGTRFIETDTG